VDEARGGLSLIIGGGLFLGLGLLLDDVRLSIIALSVGGALTLAGLYLRLVPKGLPAQASATLRPARRVLALDPAPSFLTDVDGAVIYANPAAVRRFGEERAQSLVEAMTGLAAYPSAVALRLADRVEDEGWAQEDVVTRQGFLRVTVARLATGLLSWRLEEIPDRTATTRGAEAISLPMLTVNASGTVLFVNEALRRILGGRPRQLDRIFVDLPLRDGAIHRITTPSGTVPVRAVMLDGAAGRTEIFLAPVAADAPAGSADFDALPIAVVAMDTEGRLRRANRAARELLGLADDKSDLSAVIDGPGRPFARWVAEAAAARDRVRPEIVSARGRGGERFLRVTLGRADGPDGPEVIGVLSDVTEMKALEGQLVQSQKMHAVGQLAGGIAHDFNNLLTAISGHCDLLLLRHDPGDGDYADLTQIAENANRAAALVAQLLAFSRKQTLRLEVMDVRDTLSDLAHLLNRLVGERVTLSVRNEPDLPNIRADRRNLEQVLVNLVVNARDAMAEGGEIRIRTARRHLDEDERIGEARVPPGEYVQITVEDDGPGIPEEILRKVFEPFFTTKPQGEGTGLGLSTSYGIVKQMGGYIFADSPAGGGAVFTLLLPATDEEAEARPAGPRPPRLSRRGQQRTVMLVEDEAPVRAFAARALTMMGHKVLAASSGEEALEILAGDAPSVDLVVTDVVMPGIDGPTWVRRAFGDAPEIPIVFVSGYAEGNVLSGADSMPGAEFLGKPFSLSALNDLVSRKLGPAEPSETAEEPVEGGAV